GYTSCCNAGLDSGGRGRRGARAAPAGAVRAAERATAEARRGRGPQRLGGGRALRLPLSTPRGRDPRLRARVLRAAEARAARAAADPATRLHGRGDPGAPLAG